MRKNKLKKSVAVTLAAVTLAGAVPSNIALASSFHHNNFETALQEKIGFLQSIEHYEFLKVSEIINYYINLIIETGDPNIVIPDNEILVGRANYYILNNPDFNIIGGLSSLHNLISVIPDHSVNADIRDELEYIISRVSLDYTNVELIGVADLINRLEGLDHDLINAGLEARKMVRGYIERALELSQKADTFRDPFDNDMHLLDNTFNLIREVLGYISTYGYGSYGNVIFDVNSPSLDMLMNNTYESYTEAISHQVSLNALRTVLLDLIGVGRSGVYVEIMYHRYLEFHTISGTANLISRVDSMLHSLEYIIDSIDYIEKAALELLGVIPTWYNFDTIELPYFAYYTGFYEVWMAYVASQRRSDLIWGRLEILAIAMLYLEFVIDYGLTSDEALNKAQIIFFTAS